MIAPILMAIGMVISNLVEALLPGGGTAGGAACKPLPKDEKVGKNGSGTNLKPW